MSVSGKSYGAAWHDLDVGRWSIASRLREALRVALDPPPIERICKLSQLTPGLWRCRVYQLRGERIVPESRLLTEAQIAELEESGAKVLG